MTFTVLRGYDGRAQRKDGTYYDVKYQDCIFTKRYIKVGGSAVKKGARNLGLYRYEANYDFEDTEELYPHLLEWAKDPHMFIIRQKYKMECNISLGELVQRKMEFTTNYPSTIIGIDIDGIKRPKHISATDIKGQADYVCNIMHKLCPELIPDALGYIVQASSSAGMSDYIKLHLWFDNTEYLTQAQCKLFFADLNARYKDQYDTDEDLVDLALFNPVQPHYVADPFFGHGVEDPFKGKPRITRFIGSYANIPTIEVPEYKYTPWSKDFSMLESIRGGEEPSKHLEEELESLRNWTVDRGGARTRVLRIYHTAVQECYCTKKLDKEVREILDVIRPGEADNYIEQGKTVALGKVVSNAKRDMGDSVLGIPIKDRTLVDDSFYLKGLNSFSDNTALFLKASLGTGKTQSISNYLKDFEGTFLSITNTVALVESNAERFGAGVYKDEQALLDIKTGGISRICSTIHSINKIEKNNFDLVFIDECDAVLNDILFAKIISEDKKAAIVEKLSKILMSSNSIVLSDGDISDETMEGYVRLMKGQKNLEKVNHIRKNLENGTAIKHKSIESLLGAMQGSLESGDKCILVSDLSPQRLNSFFHTFSRTLPSKVGVVLHANSKEDEPFRDIVNNTTEALVRRKIDYALCSPSITNGVDFRYFDTIFVITTTNNHSPNMRFQALKRERRANHIHYFLNKGRAYGSGYSKTKDLEGFLDTNRKNFALRKERECEHYINTFNYYLVNSGCTIIVEDEAYKNPQTEEDKLAAIHERAQAIIDNVSSPRNNDAQEMRKIVEHFLGSDLTLNQVIAFLKGRVYEKAEYLNSVIKDFWYVLKFADVSLLLQELNTDKGALFSYLSGSSIPRSQFKKHTKIKLVEAILDNCGLLENKAAAIHNYKLYCDYHNIPVIQELQEDITTHDIL